MRHPAKNHILAALPRREYERLASSLQPEQLPAGSVLYESGERVSDVYFLNTGMVSLVSAVDERSLLEVGIIGNEGMVGISAILGLNRMPQRAVVHLPGHALKAKLSTVRNEFKKGGKLQSLLLRSLYFLNCQITQWAVCNRFHPTEARLCRSLLLCRERLSSNEVPLTQQLLSQMLGAARPMVSIAAANLQSAGIIEYSRGRISILDPERLKSNACGCYKTVAQEYRRFLQAIRSPMLDT